MAVPIEPLPVLPERRCHMAVKAGRSPAIPKCGEPTIPGLLSERSCVFYGARWMLAAIPDVVHLVHGPAGCAYYGSTVRRKGYRVYSSMMEERDIVFGGSGRLHAAILEAVKREPGAHAVLVYATCAAGLIGEDLDAVCRKASRATGLQVVPVNSPGFCGRSQASGHDLAAGVLLRHFIGGSRKRKLIPGGVNILGEFDVQGDLNEIEALLRRLGLRIICAFSGRAPTAAMAEVGRAQLNIVHCRRTGHMLAEGMHKQYGTPFIKVSFFGLEETAASLRRIGEFFNLDSAVVEDVIESGRAEAGRMSGPFLKRLRGKRAALFFGASRMGSMTRAFGDLGMDVVMIGSQFGCRNDYEDADPKVAEGTLVLDDAPEQELEVFMHRHHPDLMCGGTKEKYLAHKLCVPFLVFPQESSPFTGFRGFVNLARDVAGLVSAPVWRLAGHA
jgi:nitrogenase molybdenum-cofactor synthesis protein NifE